MSEEIINVTLTEGEVEILMGLLHDRACELMKQHSVNGLGEVADRAAELIDIETDLREQLFRGEWRNDVVPDTAVEMVQKGIVAREQVKASSLAADRRKTRSQHGEFEIFADGAEVSAESEKMIKLMEGTAYPGDADFMNDPLNW